MVSKGNVKVVGTKVTVAKAVKSKKGKAVSETDSDGPKSEFKIHADAFQSVGWQSPSLRKSFQLKIVYPDLSMKHTKS